MKGKIFLEACVLIVAVSLATDSHAAAAKSRFKVGDKIEVLVVGEWQQTTVLNLNAQGAILAEIEFASRKSPQVVSPVHARLACEVGAVAPTREWKDASGEFRIRAAALTTNGDKVTLRKPDMEEIDVPISRLSKADQKFLARLKKDAAPEAGGPGPAVPPRQIAVETFAVRKEYGAQQGSPADATGRVALAPDPLPGYMTLQQGGAVLSNPGFFARVSAVLPVGGPDGWLLGVVENIEVSKAAPTQLVWVSLARNKIEGRQLLPPGEIVLDYHPPSHRLLSRAWEDPVAGRGQEGDALRPLTVWEVLPADNRATPVARWVPKAETRDPTQPIPVESADVSDRWMRLADGNTVLQPWNTSELAAWDIQAKQMRYRIARNTSLFCWPTLTGTRKYLFLPDNERVRVLDSLSGRVLSVLPTSYYVSAVAVSDDGRRIATSGGGIATVWDLNDAESAPREYQAESLGSSPFSPMQWQNDERLWAAADSKSLSLFSLKHRAVLWSYQFPVDSKAMGKFGRVREIVRDHVAYAAAAGTLPGPGGKGLAIGAVALPGPKVEEADAGFDRESLVAIRPGSTIRLVLETGENDARVQAALEARIEESGWILEPNSTTVLTAKMGRKDPQQVTYYDSNNRPFETVSVAPYYSTATIEYEGKRVLHRSVGTFTPSLVFLEKGETVQEEIDEFEKPNVAFFEQLHLPKEILHPEKRKGVGTTRVTNRGLVVVAPAAKQPLTPGSPPLVPRQ